jgi:hypothetical protein
MPIVTREYVVRRPGIQAPPHIVERLKRFHPTVRLVWNVARDCFQLIEIGDDQKWRHVRLLRNHRTGKALPVTMENTVQFLDQHDMRRLQNKAALDRWLGEIDGAHDHDETKRNEDLASDKFKEGTNALWRAMGKRIVIAAKPSP